MNRASAWRGLRDINDRHPLNSVAKIRRISGCDVTSPLELVFISYKLFKFILLVSIGPFPPW